MYKKCCINKVALPNCAPAVFGQLTTSSGQQMVLTQGKVTTAGAGVPQTDGKAAAGQSVVLAQGKAVGTPMVLAPSNTNSFAAMAPNQSLLIGGQVSTALSVLTHSGYSDSTSLVHAVTYHFNVTSYQL